MVRATEVYAKVDITSLREVGDIDMDPFLADHQGRPILRQTAALIFKRVREQAGLDRPTCRAFRPRLHDFRHRFAMNRLVSWYREGKNVQRLLPHLSTYMGHRERE
jgi:integrase/recombinase XerD